MSGVNGRRRAGRAGQRGGGRLPRVRVAVGGTRGAGKMRRERERRGRRRDVHGRVRRRRAGVGHVVVRRRGEGGGGGRDRGRGRGQRRREEMAARRRRRHHTSQQLHHITRLQKDSGKGTEGVVGDTRVMAMAHLAASAAESLLRSSTGMMEVSRGRMSEVRHWLGGRGRRRLAAAMLSARCMLSWCRASVCATPR